MLIKIFGKKIENIYDVDNKQKEVKDGSGETKTVYTGKPIITKESKIKEWVELCSYDGEPRYNSSDCSSIFSYYKTINISENERLAIEEEIFRADLNEVHMHTNKVVETIDTKKEEAISLCEKQIGAFNKIMIKSNNKLMSYCDLHKLSYEDTDCIELFKLVFPDKKYKIKDGKMCTVDEPCVSYDLSEITSIALTHNGKLQKGDTISWC